MSPIAGLAVDRLGCNVFWILAATFFTGVSHAIMAYTFTVPLVATVLMGISYSSTSIPPSPSPFLCTCFISCVEGAFSEHYVERCLRALVRDWLSLQVMCHAAQCESHMICN